MKIKVFYHRSMASDAHPTFLLPGDGSEDRQWFAVYHLGRHLGNVFIFRRNKQRVHWVKAWRKRYPFEIELSQDTFSIGLDPDYYYKNLEETREGPQFLRAMNDALAFHDITDLAHSDPILRSLWELNQGPAQEAQRQGGLPHRQKKVDFEHYGIHFNFAEDPLGFQRIIALVGENGTGKTQMLYGIAQKFADLTSSNLSHQFSRVLALSYCMFDRHEYPKFSYRFIAGGFVAKSTNLGVGRSSERLLHALDSIRRQQRENVLMKALEQSYGKYGDAYLQILDMVKEILFWQTRPPHTRRMMDHFMERISAGQYYMLLMILEVVASITHNTLLLIDEPENMTHPDMTYGIMNFLYFILREFDSHAVVATHSVYIVQNIPSRYVKVLGRNAKPLEIETFGESIVKIAQEVFGYTQMYQFFRERLQHLAGDGQVSKQQLEAYFEERGFSLSNMIDALYREGK